MRKHIRIHVSAVAAFIVFRQSFIRDCQREGRRSSVSRNKIKKSAADFFKRPLNANSGIKASRNESARTLSPQNSKLPKLSNKKCYGATMGENREGPKRERRVMGRIRFQNG